MAMTTHFIYKNIRYNLYLSENDITEEYIEDYTLDDFKKKFIDNDFILLYFDEYKYNNGVHNYIFIY